MLKTTYLSIDLSYRDGLVSCDSLIHVPSREWRYVILPSLHLSYLGLASSQNANNSNTFFSADSCQTPNGESAKCVSVYECPILLNALPSASGRQRKFLKESQCGYSTAPLVCCGSSNNYVTTTKSSPKVSTIPDRQACGYQVRANCINLNLKFKVFSYKTCIIYD